MSVIVFRVDSSIKIGSGHVMRCLTLAKQLKSKHEVVFISRNLSGNLNEFVQQNSFKLFELPKGNSTHAFAGYEEWLTVTQHEDAQQTIDILKRYSEVDGIVVDSYAIDEKWENLIRPYVQRIMVIDDLANRKHNCDILLDQNYVCNMSVRYSNLVPRQCQLLLGPQFTLLREEFYKARENLRQRDGTVKNILVFFGGSDITNETMKSLQAIDMLNDPEINVNVIVGKNNPHKEQVQVYCYQRRNINYFCQITNIAEMMNLADIAIGAGGTTTWERSFLKLPSIVLAVADNQVQLCEACGKAGYIRYLGTASTIDIEDIYIELKQIISNDSCSKIEKFLEYENNEWSKSLFKKS